MSQFNYRFSPDIKKDKPPRRSLSVIFTTSIVSLVAVFVAVTAFSFYRLIGTNEALYDVAENSIPRVLTLNSVANSANELVFFTEQLANARTSPAWRIATTQIETQLVEIDGLFSQTEIDKVAQQEFKTISAEILELEALVSKRLDTIALIRNADIELKQLYDVLSNVNLSQSNRAIWRQNVQEMQTLTSQIFRIDKLQEIRQLSRNIHRSHNTLVALIDTFTGQEQNVLRVLVADLRRLTVSQTGIVEQRVEQLRIEGRTKGRGNFTKKLVSGFARNVQFQTSRLNTQILEESERKNTVIAEQVQAVAFAALLAFVMLSIVAWQLRCRVIDRLISLNQMVLGKLGKETEKIEMAGNDEISDIAETFHVFANKIEEQNVALSKLAMSDGLTGIANRRALDKELERQFSQAKRFNQSISVLLIDVDYFKAYNDHYGHPQGDKVLVEIADCLSKALVRNVDFVARYGGEEFVCLLPNTNAIGAMIVAENLLSSIAALNIEHLAAKHTQTLTASIGVSSLSTFDDRKLNGNALLEMADKALYQAKEGGRNRIEQYLV